MNKYQIIEGDGNDATRIEMRFRSQELQEIAETLQETYPDFKNWIQEPNNRYYFREIVNAAVTRYIDGLWTHV